MEHHRTSKSLAAVVLMAAVIAAGLTGAAVAAQPAPALRIIELKGTAAEMGQEHGQQLGSDIRMLSQSYLKNLFRNERLRQQALLGAFIFRNQLLPEHKAEMLALAGSSGVDPGEAMLANCFLDMLAEVACSTITLPPEAAPDRVARFGRNLDFMSFGIADKCSVVFIVHPEDRYGFAAVSWPGLIGVLSGMNEHGLALANMEVPRAMRMPQSMPYTLLYRMVLEQCRTVDEAIELLKKTPRQSANNLMLMDAAGNRAVVEITPEEVVVRRGPPAAALISTNHQRGQDQERPGLCRRYDRMLKTSGEQFGRIDRSALEKMLGAVAQGKSTLQSMVFEPANRTIYVAVGAEATKQEYRKIDLKGYFGQ
jgi:isopenicillin-N N-acyltransferase like protein